jgi:hypothetical protein
MIKLLVMEKAEEELIYGLGQVTCIEEKSRGFPSLLR